MNIYKRNEQIIIRQIKIFVNTPNNGQIALDVNEADTVESVKEMIQEIDGTKVEDFDIKFNGKSDNAVNEHKDDYSSQQESDNAVIEHKDDYSSQCESDNAVIEHKDDYSNQLESDNAINQHIDDFSNQLDPGMTVIAIGGSEVIFGKRINTDINYGKSIKQTSSYQGLIIYIGTDKRNHLAQYLHPLLFDKNMNNNKKRNINKSHFIPKFDVRNLDDVDDEDEINYRNKERKVEEEDDDDEEKYEENEDEDKQYYLEKVDNDQNDDEEDDEEEEDDDEEEDDGEVNLNEDEEVK
ncbi:MAG: hypothetical protein EZS28_017765, partial [Streblomastix strix]